MARAHGTSLHPGRDAVRMSGNEQDRRGSAGRLDAGRLDHLAQAGEAQAR